MARRELDENRFKLYRHHSVGCKDKADRKSPRCGCAIWVQFQYPKGLPAIKVDGKTPAPGQNKWTCKTRSWGEAHRFLIKLIDRLGSGKSDDEATKTKAEISVEAATEKYLAYVSDPRQYGQVLKHASLRKHKRMMSLLKAHCNKEGVRLLSQANSAPFLSEWRGTWKYSTDSSSMRIHDAVARAFFNWAHTMEHIVSNDYEKLCRFAAKDPQTLPLTVEEMEGLLRACAEIDATSEEKLKLRALALAQRWSGLSLIDAITLPRPNLRKDNSLELYRTKTGEPVLTLLPHSVAEMLRMLPNPHPGFFWCVPDEKHDTLRARWGKLYRQAFTLAGIYRNRAETGGGMTLSHRLRDTFAVEYLIAGGDLQDLAVLLGHSNITTTQKHYGAWVKERKLRLLRVAGEVMARQEPVGLEQSVGQTAVN